MRTLALCFAFAFAVPKLALSGDPESNSRPEISATPLSTEDLAELLNFDSYKFKIDNIRNGDRIKIEVHSYSDPKDDRRILWSHEFVKTEFTCRGPNCDPADAKQASFRIDFSSESTGRRNALSTQDSILAVSVVSNWLQPSGIHGAIDNPLRDYASTEKSTYVASTFKKQLPLTKRDDSLQRLIYIAPNADFVGRPVGKPKKWDELFPRFEVVLYLVTQVE